MIPKFKIEKERFGKYIIKRRVGLFPFSFMVTMDKSEFFGCLTPYGQNILSQTEAEFNSIDNAFDAIFQYSKIKCFQEAIVKVNDEF